jgi:predicted dehydrogenase
VHRRTIGEYLNLNHRGVKYRQESVIERIHVPIFEPLFLELQHFVDCVVEGKPTLVPARDGFKALRLATDIRNALRERLVDITTELRPLEKEIVGSAAALAELT